MGAVDFTMAVCWGLRAGLGGVGWKGRWWGGVNRSGVRVRVRVWIRVVMLLLLLLPPPKRRCGGRAGMFGGM